MSDKWVSVEDRVVGQRGNHGRATDRRDCSSGFRRCLCGPCSRCSYAKHSAIHGPYYIGSGDSLSSDPYGHEFEPVEVGEAEGDE